MTIITGAFDVLGKSYEAGTNAGLLSAIARSAEELTSGKGWPEGVNDLLEALGRVTGVSRVWIFQTMALTETHLTQNYTFEWAAAPKYKQIGMSMFSMFTNPIDRPAYRSLIESRLRGEWQKVLLSQLGPGWFRDELDVQKIKSMLTLPVMVENQWWGTLGFDDCEREYDWSDVEISLLRTAGYLISNAVLHDRLSANHKQFEILKRLTDSSVWEFDFNTGQFWCSPEMVNTVPGLTENLRFSLHGALRQVHPNDRHSLLAAVKGYVAMSKGIFRHDLRLLTDCGGLRWVELIGSLRRNSEGRPEQFAGIAVDIRVRKQEEERLREEAVTDPLTGIMNRRMFERKLQDQIDLSLGSGASFVIILFDIDRFKDLNDTYGHHVGDLVLCYFSDTCANVLRKQDVFARIGGDEFAVIFPDVDSDIAQRVGERIRRDISSAPYEIEGESIKLTISGGLALHQGGLTTPAKLLERDRKSVV